MMEQERQELFKIAYARYRAEVIASGGKATAESVFSVGFLYGWESRARALNRNRPSWASKSEVDKTEERLGRQQETRRSIRETLEQVREKP